MLLPEALVPFSVTVPFEVKADLYKLGSNLLGQNEDKLFRFDSDYPGFVEQKLNVLSRYPEHSRCYLKADIAKLTDCLWRVAALMAQDQPEYVSSHAEGISAKLLGLHLSRQGDLVFDAGHAFFAQLAQDCYKHLERLEPFDKLCDFLALAVQEDLVIMHKTGQASNADVAECLLVSLPSHWDPLAKLGLDFGAIHEPIPDNMPLKRAQPNMLKAMVNKGPFVRYNWSLASSADLAQNPKLLGYDPRLPKHKAKDGVEAMLASLHFRVERQTLHAFPDLQRGLFAIRIFQEPLQKTLNSSVRKSQLALAIQSMSAGMLRYKGIDRYKELLLDYLAKA